MLSTFRVFGSIPASLVKEIRITQNNSLNNNSVNPIKEFGAEASGIDYYINTKKIAINSNVNAVASDAKCRITIDGKMHSSANIALRLTEHYVGLTNGSVPLEVTTDSTG